MLISTNSGLYSAVPGRPRLSMADAMDFFGEVGFEAVDVNFCATIFEGDRHEPVLDGDFHVQLDAVLGAAARNGLAIAHTHLPFYRYDLPERETLARYEAMMLRAIEATAYLGAKYAVIHPFRDEQLGTLVEESVRHLTPFRDAAQAQGVTLAVENMRDTSAETLAALVDALGVAACWDVGHANLGGFDQGASLRVLGNRLKTLHLHDNYAAKDDHSLPYLGTVDWQGFLQALFEIGYDGVFNYEVSAVAVPLPLRRPHARYLIAAAHHMLGRDA